MGKYLIAYVTKTNTTKEAALEIAKVLSESDIKSDVLPISEVTDLAGYDSVIIGAPINGMSWHADAVKFVEDNKEALSAIPVHYYFMSYLIITGRNFFQKIINKSLDKAGLIVKPKSVGMFGGKVDSEFPAAVRMLFGVKKNAPTDVRDIEKVRDWAKNLS